jgi:hypothetical protein
LEHEGFNESKAGGGEGGVDPVVVAGRADPRIVDLVFAARLHVTAIRELTNQ